MIFIYLPEDSIMLLMTEQLGINSLNKDLMHVYLKDIYMDYLNIFTSKWTAGKVLLI